MSFQQHPIDWQPPDGLGYSSLRPVRLSGHGIAFACVGVMFLILGPVLGLFMSSVSRKQTERQTLFREQGVDVTAVITRVWRSGGKDDLHMVAYRFSMADGEREGRASAPLRIWTGLRTGAPLAIRYLPGRPGVNHPAEWQEQRMPDWLPWFLGPMLTWPALLFWYLIRRESRLLQEGRPAPGIVTAVKRTGKQIIIYYDFTLLSGAVMKGKSSGGRRPPGVGSSVCVLYYPDNPRRNALYPLQFVKLQ